MLINCSHYYIEYFADLHCTVRDSIFEGFAVYLRKERNTLLNLQPELAHNNLSIISFPNISFLFIDYFAIYLRTRLSNIEYFPIMPNWKASFL